MSLSSRAALLQQLTPQFDVVVIGGGITGAAIALESARHGLKVALFEQRDFAWGTSSRSSKLVHGGLRYLKEGQLHLTAESVKEREALKQEAKGLVEPQSFMLAHYPNRKPGKLTFKLGLMIYDAIAKKRSHRFINPQTVSFFAPYIDQHELQGGMQYWDAKTDDARLVLRVLAEAQAAGAIAINYCGVEKLIQEKQQVVGVEICDTETQQRLQVKAKVVVSATGAWADKLRSELGAQPKIRPLRGTHLIFPLWKIPVAQAVSFFHPYDGRPVFIYPWEGVALLGTTDVDHNESLDQEACVTPEEAAYLLAAIQYQFPMLKISLEDAISTYSGVRPVIGSGQADPSKESRDHLIVNEQGLITVTGGKLTTFRPIALDTLKAIGEALKIKLAAQWQPVFQTVQSLKFPAGIAESVQQRLMGRYGSLLQTVLHNPQPKDFQFIGETETLWLELRLVAQDDSIVHLDDLLLRRTRLGNLLREGGKDLLPAIRETVQPILAWPDEKWQQEVERYLLICQRYYSVPSSLPALETYLHPKEKKQV